MIIVVHNRKGGVGKTTTSVNLAANLAAVGERVLLIDGDNQHNASRAFGCDPAPKVWEWVTTGRFDPVTVRPTLAVLPTAKQPSALDPAWMQVATVEHLRQRLAALPTYDWVFVDTPPSDSPWIRSWLALADAILIPVDFSLYSIEGVSELLEELDRSRIIGLVPVRYDLRNNRSIELLDVLKHAGGSLVAPPIRVSVDIDRAVQFGQSIAEFNAHAPVTADYHALTDWMVMTLAETAQ